MKVAQIRRIVKITLNGGKTWIFLLFVLVLINYLAKVLKINRSKIVPVNLLWQLLIWNPRKKLYICVPIDRIYRLEEHLVINIVIWDVLKVAILYDFRLHVIWIKMWNTSRNVKNYFQQKMWWKCKIKMVSQRWYPKKILLVCMWSTLVKQVDITTVIVGQCKCLRAFFNG